jgi:hypothetical protein
VRFCHLGPASDELPCSLIIRLIGRWRGTMLAVVPGTGGFGGIGIIHSVIVSVSAGAYGTGTGTTGTSLAGPPGMGPGAFRATR